MYVSQDPIGLLSGEFGFYNYVNDTNSFVDILGLAKCKMNAKNKRANKVKYSKFKVKNGHHHHIVREAAPKKWDSKSRDYILKSQARLKLANIDLNSDPRNFTWAQNGGGAHTKDAAKYVWDKIKNSANIDQTLQDLADEMHSGKFF